MQTSSKLSLFLILWIAYCSSQDASLLVKLSFDDPAQPFLDTSPNAQANTCSGAFCPTFVFDGITTGACRFDGAQYLKYVSLPVLNRLDDVTISVWYKPERGNPWAKLVCKAVSPFVTPFAQYCMTFQRGAGDRRIQFLIAGDVDSNELEPTNLIVPPLGQWHHLAGVYNRTHMMLYLNGTLVGSQATRYINITSGPVHSLYIGGRSDNGLEGAAGLIDEVMVWKRPLSETEVSALYTDVVSSGDTAKSVKATEAEAAPGRNYTLPILIIVFFVVTIIVAIIIVIVYRRTKNKGNNRNTVNEIGMSNYPQTTSPRATDAQPASPQSYSPRATDAPPVELQSSPFNSAPSSPINSRNNTPRPTNAQPPDMSPSMGGPMGKIFGAALHVAKQSNGIPEVMDVCINHLEQYGLNEQGLLRLTGSNSEAKYLKDVFEAGNVPDMNSIKDINSVSDVLKLYLRSLPQKIYAPSPDTKAYAETEGADPAMIFQLVYNDLRSLPPMNYQATKRLFALMTRVANNAYTNRMKPEAIAIVFRPTLNIPINVIIMLITEPQIFDR